MYVLFILFPVIIWNIPSEDTFFKSNTIWRESLTSLCIKRFWCESYQHKGFPGGSVVKNLPANAVGTGDVGLIPGSGRPSEGRNGNPLQCSCLKIPRTEEPGRLQSVELQRVEHRGSSWPRDQTHVFSFTTEFGKFFTTEQCRKPLGIIRLTDFEILIYHFCSLNCQLLDHKEYRH